MSIRLCKAAVAINITVHDRMALKHVLVWF